ncbi:MAG: bifunctional diaminohydroxyphosphoribosylaminopyrimidine deaminase/5-amino-6-(5-phosphoribosylamino)uracil reductase RibD [Acidobacteriaceae bacterium]
MDAFSSADREFMLEALTLARSGVGLVSPNPAVGAVLVNDGKVVGRGFHTYQGKKHAEVLALEDAANSARGSTVYLNLEPCSHFGRTGPCCDALIAAGVRRVVCAMQDPNPEVSGQGFLRLRAAGVQVDTGLSAAEAKSINESFARWIRTSLPFVTLKAGMSLDARIAPPQNADAPPWITSEGARQHAQTLRHQHDAILVGIGTVLADDPLLNDRTGLPRRRPLLRIVLDHQLRLPLDSRLLKSASSDLLVICRMELTDSENAQSLRNAGAEVLGVDDEDSWQRLLRELASRQITSLLIEGGAHVFASALQASVVDKLALYVAPLILGDGALSAFQEAPGIPELANFHARSVAGNLLLTGYIHDPYGES